MSSVSNGLHGHTAAITARRREDVFVAGEIVRHQRASRLIHWSVAITFFLSLISGMPIWSPIFGWMAALVGGLEVARIIHPYAGVLFFVLSVVQFFHWVGDMHISQQDRGWLKPSKLMAYMRYEDEPAQEGGKYNPGQKMFFFAVSLGAVGLTLSGIIIWFPRLFPPIVRELSYLLHDITFICFVVAIITHIYLGTIAEPGTFRAMSRGTVTRAWARLHHPDWFREVTQEKRED